MTREQIEKAAMEYAVRNSWYPGETSYESDIKAMEESFADAFKDGAQWRINSVWHDRTEKAEFITENTEIGDDWWIFGFDTAHWGDNKYDWDRKAVTEETLSMMEKLNCE